MAEASATAGAAAEPKTRFSGLFGWVLFDWATQPFYTLILTFIFAPYFATAFVGDPVKGQALWGYFSAIAGLIVALSGPILGSVADTRRRRKPWVAFFSLPFMLGMSALWFAHPGAEEQILFIAVAFIVAAVSAEFATIFTNSMMPTLVPDWQLGRLSGIGWGVGYVGGMVALIIMMGLIITVPGTGETLFRIEPIITLDEQTHEADRLSGPFSALWYLVFALPFFLFTPDRHTGTGGGKPLLDGLRLLWHTLKEAREHKQIFFFLLARIAYVDGLGAIFAFGGIYAAGLFGWREFELGLFGIILTVAATIGALAGGVIDDRIGSKRVVVGALTGLIIGTLGILSIDKTHILFAIDVPEKTAGSDLFSSDGEIAYLAFAIVIGLVAGPLQASSRSLMARLAPPQRMTQFFGLFAFSGKIASFLAPFMVATATAAAASQRAGVAAIIPFLLVGLGFMALVKSNPR